MRWGGHAMSGALFVVALAYVWESFGFKPTPRLFPLLVGIPMLILTAFQIVIELFPDLEKKYAEIGTVDAEMLAGKTRDRVVEEDSTQIQKELEVFLWLGLAVGLSMLLGFFWGIPLFIFVFLKFRYAERWTISAGLPLGTLFVMHVLFERLFQIPLYTGLLSK
jgi:hypothetical protein